MWQDYLTEFSGILSRVVARLDAETPYWPSSPSADYEETTATIRQATRAATRTSGTCGTGACRSATYETHHARFVTEYGFQSFPEMRTIEAFTQPEDRKNIFTPVMLVHQKNNEGNSIIHDYLLKDYPEPKDFRELSVCEPGAAGGGNQDRRGAFPAQHAGDDGLDLLAVERLLAGGFVVEHRLLRPLEGAAILCAEILCADPGFAAR